MTERVLHGVRISAPAPLGAPAPESSGALTALEAAILRTVAYADVFDYPLTGGEIHRYLVGIPASHVEVQSALAGGALIPHRLESHGDYYALPGRAEIVPIRLQRKGIAGRLWPAARRYAAWIARFPFVRMIAVTGALAVDNATEVDDIDYFIVTEPGKLWLCRALIIAVVKLARRRGDDICPNFFLSERALTIGEQNLFSAHELVQMVPLAGPEVYERMMAANRWATAYLPNTNGQARRFAVLPTRGRIAKGLLEALLRTPPWAWLERWEMRRKIAKFTQQLGEVQTPEVAFSADRCQGHFRRHGERALGTYTARLLEIEEEATTYGA
jgi:hypothetical protein